MLAAIGILAVILISISDLSYVKAIWRRQAQAPSLYVVHLPDDRARDLRLSVRPWLTRQPVCLWLVRSGQPHDILPVADARSGRGRT